jgi:outer membrane protein W
MKLNYSVFALVAAAALSAPSAFAQSKGEASYEEHCARVAPKGTAAEQATTRQRCIDDAKKAAKTDVPGAANQPGTTATRGTSKTDKQAARDKRRAEGATVAKQPKQDPKNPTN